MVRNHLKAAVRRIGRRRSFALINMLGLAVAMAATLVIALFVRHELSYDRFHAKADRLYRLTLERTRSNDVMRLATTAPPMGPAIAAQFPEVEQSVRLRYAREVLLAHGDRRFYEDRLFYADSTFFELFSFPFQAGDPRTALRDPGAIVLTADMARKYFGDADPMGQTLRLDDARDFTVSGVLEPLPEAVHLDFDFLIPFSAFRIPRGYPVTLDDWGWGGFYTYLLLAEGTDAAALEARLGEVIAANVSAERVAQFRLGLQPITDIYLDPTYREHNGVVAAGNERWLYGLGAIGALLLLIAGFNYTNLATAHALERAREVGVRKALGASRPALVAQFIGEALLLCGLSTALGGLLAALFLKGIAAQYGLQLEPAAGDWGFLLVLSLGALLLLGALAGSYPAFVLARFQPSQVLKGALPTHLGGTGLRRTLVVLQFAASMVLIATTLVIVRQMDYLRSKDLGFDQEHVVALHVTGDVYARHYEQLRARMLQNPGVVAVSAGDLFDGTAGSVPIFWDGVPSPDGRAMNIFGIHYDFLETVGIDVVQGRGLSRSLPGDSATGILVNRAAVDVFGWDEPIGQAVRVFDLKEGYVIGVVEDFHFASLHETVAPLVLYMPGTNLGNIVVRLAPGDPAAHLAALRRDWQAVVPGLPFDYTFLDDHVDQLYQAETRFAHFMKVFAALAIFVACLGLYGLVALTLRQRTRELAIRKILGGTMGHLFWLILHRFARLIVAACLLAAPVAYFTGEHWLRDFAYRAELGLLPFAGAAALIIGLALLATGAHALQAARSNPVDHLRYE